MSGGVGAPAEKEVHLGRWHMLLAYLSGAFGFGFQNMVGLLVPLRARELEASPEIIGLLVGAGAAAPVLLGVVSGALADRVGPRRAYIAGTGFSVLIAALLSLADSVWVMLVLQLFIGLGRSSAWVASQTYITSLGSPAQRATITGRFSFATNIGPLLGPLAAGAAIQIVGYGASFLVAAAFAGLFTLIGLGLAEIPRASRSVGTGDRAGIGFNAGFGLLRLPAMQVVLMLTLVRLWIWSGWVAFFPVYLADRGFEPVTIGSVVAANGAVSTVAALGAGRLARLLGQQVAIAAALAVGALGVALSPPLAVFPLVYLPSMLMGLAFGVSLPLLLVLTSSSAPPGQRGVALGLRSSANQLASTVAPITLGALITPIGVAASFALSSMAGWVVLALAMVLHVRTRPRPSVADQSR